MSDVLVTDEGCVDSVDGKAVLPTLSLRNRGVGSGTVTFLKRDVCSTFNMIGDLGLLPETLQRSLGINPAKLIL